MNFNQTYVNSQLGLENFKKGTIPARIGVMQIDILTLFPEMFAGPFGSGMLKRAIERNMVKIDVHNIRDWTHDKHHTVDDYPYGGGAGMVLKPQPIFEAVEAVTESSESQPKDEVPVILLSPQGRLFSHSIAADLARYSRMILICGHYEGVDERVAKRIADIELSIGDYDLMGGELPAMIVMETIARLIPGVIGKPQLLKERITKEKGFIEYPQYTRPEVFKKWRVPNVLLSGSHKKIEEWRKKYGKIIGK